MSNTFEDLYQEFMVYVDKDDEQGARKFLLDNFQKFPEDVQDIVHRATKVHVARQRAYTDRFNRELETTLAGRGMMFNTTDTASFRRALAGDFYRTWRERLGTTAWRLLEDSTGRLGT